MQSQSMLQTFRVSGYNIPISRKKAIEIASFIKYLTLPLAKRYLVEVIEKKRSVPFRRYNRDVGHRKDLQGPVKSGRYPVKTARYFLKLLESLEKNVQYLGGDPNKVVLYKIEIGKGTTVTGRIRKRIVRRKRTHVFIEAVLVPSLDVNVRKRRKILEALDQALKR